MSARKYRQNHIRIVLSHGSARCVFGVSNEWEHCVRPETEQQKSPLTNQLEHRTDRIQSTKSETDALTSESDDQLQTLLFALSISRDVSNNFLSQQ